LCQYIKLYHKLIKIYILSIWVDIAISEILTQLDIIYVNESVWVPDSDLTRLKRICFASTFEIRFLSVVFVSCSLFSSCPTYLGVVSSFCIFLFLFLFESSVSFIFQIDSLATRETIIAVLFCLFSRFYCFLHIYIYIWIALPSWLYLVLVSVPQEPQEGETRGVSL